MKISLICILSFTALWLPSSMAAPSKRLKGGLKGSKQSRNSASVDQRQLQDKETKDSSKEAKKARKILKGPTARDCGFSTKGGSEKESGSGSQEVKFSCEARNAGLSDTTARGIMLDPGNLRDKVQYKVKTDRKGIRVKVEYKTEYEEDYGVDDYTDTKTSFEVLFDSIVEYSKTDAYTEDDEQAYDWENDVILQTHSLSEWGNFTNVTDSPDGQISYFSVQSLDKVAEFNFTINRADVGESATANSMKIDIRIVQFPWLQTDTNLALMSTVKSELKVEMTYTEDAEVTYNPDGSIAKQHQAKWTQNAFITFDDATKDIGFVPFGDYTWEESATATIIDELYFNPCSPSLLEKALAMNPNASFPIECINATLTETSAPSGETGGIRVVGTSPPEEMVGNETLQHIAYSFVGPGSQYADEIYWDPQAGIGYQEVESSAFGSGTPATILFGLVGAVLVSGILNIAL